MTSEARCEEILCQYYKGIANLNDIKCLRNVGFKKYIYSVVSDDSGEEFWIYARTKEEADKKLAPRIKKRHKIETKLTITDL